MQILILEDEPLVARSLIAGVKELEPNAHLIGPIGSVKEAQLWFKENLTPDLILSDIQLSDGVSFELFRIVSTPCPIIFTTAYDEYAVRAFKLNSIDYLLKPIDPEELKHAFKKFYRNRTSATPPSEGRLGELLEHLEKAMNSYKRRFLAHHHRTVVAVSEIKVAFFMCDEVIWLITTDGQRLITDHTSLDELDEILDPSAFFRANRKYFVRKDAIEGYRTHHTGKLELAVVDNSEEEISVSKEKAPSFRKWFEEG